MKNIFSRKKQSPLYNPLKGDLHRKEFESEPRIKSEDNKPEEKPEVSEEQIDLGIKESKLEPIYKIRRSISKMEKTAEAMPFWKSEVIVVAMVISIFFIAIVAGLIYLSFSALPEQVPIFYDHNTNRWGLYDKAFLLFIPIIYGIIVFAVWRIIYSVFLFDHRLALVTTWVLILFSIFGIVGVSQIISLILV